MACILFIGYGNPLRGDDGFGWHLAQRLQDHFREGEIEVAATHQLTPELAEPISRARYVIFADASADPGADTLMLKRLWEGSSDAASVSHHLGPETLLTLARMLYGSIPQAAFLLTAGAHEFGYSEELSPEMNSELDRAVKRVADLCEFLHPEAFARPIVPEKI